MTSDSPQATADSPSNASLGQRVGALLLDGLILTPLYIAAAVLFGRTNTSGASFQLSLSGVPFLLTTLIALSYFVVLEMLLGATLGKKAVGITVVSDKDGSKVGAGPALIRNVLRIVDGFAFYAVGFFIALASAKNQRLGDKAGSTRVIKSR